MPDIRLAALIGTCLAIWTGPATAAGWIELPGPTGNLGSPVIQTDDGTLLLSSYGSVLQRRPGSDRWTSAGLEVQTDELAHLTRTVAGTVLAATERGNYRRQPTDGSWIALEYNVAPAQLYAMADGSVVGVSSGRLSRSPDGIHGWHVLPADLPNTEPYDVLEVNGLAMLANGGLLAATSSGLSLSDAAVTSWEIAIPDVYALGARVADDGTAYALLPGPDGWGTQWLRSTDDAATWSPVVVSDTSLIHFVTAPGGVVIVGSYTGLAPDSGGSSAVLWVSRDGGDTFQCLLGHHRDCSLSPAPPRLDAISSLRLLADGSLLVAGNPLHFSGWPDGADGLWLSPDLGISWSPAGLDGFTVHSIAELADGALWCGTDAPLFTAAPGGFDWQLASDGLRAQQVRHVVATGDVVVASVENDGVQRSLDGGRTWTRLGPAAVRVVDVDANRAGDVVIAAGSSLWLWHGATWTDLAAGADPPFSPTAVALTPAGTVCTGASLQGGTELRCTPDRGASWSVYPLDSASLFDMAATGSGVVVARVSGHSASAGASFLRTDDGGASWGEVWSVDTNVYDLSRDAAGRLIGVLQGGSVFEADTDGMSWTVHGPVLEGLYSVARDAAGRWYAAGNHDHVVTSAEGTDWQPFQAGISTGPNGGSRIQTLASGDTLVYAATLNYGLLARRLPSAPLPPQAPSPALVTE